MLKITIPDLEFYNSAINEFTYSEGGLLILEHSLVSVSKWESNWNKPFLVNENKSKEEALDYVKCMTLNNVDDEIYIKINDAVMDQIVSYINKNMTATTFSKKKRPSGNREIITAEIIYYWMFTLGVPKECERWHLSRLLTLIRVCSEKNAPKKKMGTKEAIEQQRMINEANRKRFNTKG